MGKNKREIQRREVKEDSGEQESKDKKQTEVKKTEKRRGGTEKDYIIVYTWKEMYVKE